MARRYAWREFYFYDNQLVRCVEGGTNPNGLVQGKIYKVATARDVPFGDLAIIGPDGFAQWWGVRRFRPISRKADTP